MIPWDSNNDVLGFEFQHVYENAELLKVIKRNNLGVLACLFATFGVINPNCFSQNLLPNIVQKVGASVA